MNFRGLFLGVFCCLALVSLPFSFAIQGTVLHAWPQGVVDFTFRTQAERDYYMNSGIYKDCILNGLKVAPDGRRFASIRRGGKCPVTLARILDNFQLDPFPSWIANGGFVNDKDSNPWRKDPSLLQSVLGIEIDPCNRLWVLDQGISSGFAALPNSAKLLIYNLTTGELLHKHTFPSDVILPEQSFLDDLSVDLAHNFAYITDAGVPHGDIFSAATAGALIVYDVTNDVSWRILHNHTSVDPDPELWPEAAGEKIGMKSPVKVGADGAGLSSDASVFYYTALSSHAVWSIPTSVLRASRQMSASDIANAVELVYNDTGGIAGGILSGDDGRLYLTDLTNNATRRLNRDNSLSPIFTDPRMMWPDGLGFAAAGQLVLFANQLQHVINAEPVTEQTMWQITLDEKVSSYMSNWAPLCPQKSPSPASDCSEVETYKWYLLVACVVGGLLFFAIMFLCYQRTYSTSTVAVKRSPKAPLQLHEAPDAALLPPLDQPSDAAGYARL